MGRKTKKRNTKKRRGRTVYKKRRVKCRNRRGYTCIDKIHYLTKRRNGRIYDQKPIRRTIYVRNKKGYTWRFKMVSQPLIQRGRTRRVKIGRWVMVRNAPKRKRKTKKRK